MAATEAQLLARLEALGIETTTVRHAPLFTVADSQRLRGDIPGGHCKSLFLKNKKGRHWLLVADEARPIDLKRLAKRLKAGNLSFAGAEALDAILGVAPGAVTPFALINDPDHEVTVVLDADMLAAPRLNYHPLTNDATTTIRSADLKRFIAASGHLAYIIDFERDGEPERVAPETGGTEELETTWNRL
ncbi:MAG: prolyl-tRNA synthetase associated domain-containing protein [Alphaproteobacteria bacterium]|nr:prolyl-tRNA synthetase associated domain-containing protein [Alphaproteobacteria bacterium]MDP6516072.1 prolyl-tRNA synthetase associated domain-containing protein [Alphaproteobacteria bacterium]